MRILFARSGPLNMTPAVERYADFLRRAGFKGELLGVELDYQPDRPEVRFVDELDALRASYSNTLQRLWMLARWQAFQLRSFWRRRPDVIQVCDVFSALPALVVKWLRPTVLVFDVRDPARLTLRHWGRVPSALLGWLESFTEARSDVVVMVSEPLKQLLDPGVQARTVVVPNAPQQDRFEGPWFSADGKLRISLAGFISHSRNLTAWCEVARSRPDVQLDVYGNVYDDKSREILARYGIPPPRSLPHADAMARMVQSDAVSILYDPTIEVFRYSAPNKFFDALMLGKPVLCAKGMHLTDEVASAGCGLAVTYDDPSDLARALDLLKDEGTRRRMGEAARRHFVERYLGAPDRARREVYRRAGVLPG
jgi:glycosyltransferase involved in cell wall biosynthesis